MTKRRRISLDRDKIAFWTAVIGLVKSLIELVIKAVSYGNSRSKFSIYLPA